MRHHALRLAALAALVALALAAGGSTEASAPPPPLLVPLTPTQARAAAADGPGTPGEVISALEAAPGTASLTLASLSTAALGAPSLTLPIGSAIPPAPATWAAGAGGQGALAEATTPPPPSLVITRTSLEPGSVRGALTWTGTTAGVVGSEEGGPAHEAILTVVDGAVAGTVRQGGRLWQVRTVVPGEAAKSKTEEGAPGASSPAGPVEEVTKPALNPANGAVVALVAIDEAAFPPDDAEEKAAAAGAPVPEARAAAGEDAPPSAPPSIANESDPSTSSAAAYPLIRVQFLYTPATRSALGGDAPARALAAHSIDLANAGLANSAIPDTVARFQWTGGAAVVPEAREADGWFALRNKLANPQDGWADWATGHDRAAAQADMTVMLIGMIDLCGLAIGIGRAQASPSPVALVSHVCVAKHSVLHEVSL